MSSIAHRSSDATDNKFVVTPLHPTIGAEISMIDLREPLQESTYQALRRLLVKHRVLFFRDQDVTHLQLKEFARHFGSIEQPQLSDAVEQMLGVEHVYSGPGYPSINTNCWHTDWSGMAEPSMGLILKATEVPEIGGDTLFADMIAAYDGLSDDLKVHIADMVAVHDMRGYLATIEDLPDDQHGGSEFPPQEHPVVRTHPESGEKILYVNSLFTIAIKSLPKEESRALLKLLCKQAAIPEHQIRFQWRKNSIAFIDNRSCQHYASRDYGPVVRRLERIVIAGDKPF